MRIVDSVNYTRTGRMDDERPFITKELGKIIDRFCQLMAPQRQSRGWMAVPHIHYNQGRLFIVQIKRIILNAEMVHIVVLVLKSFSASARNGDQLLVPILYDAGSPIYMAVISIVSAL